MVRLSGAVRFAMAYRLSSNPLFIHAAGYILKAASWRPDLPSIEACRPLPMEPDDGHLVISPRTCKRRRMRT
jgi:hypothetical protein